MRCSECYWEWGCRSEYAIRCASVSAPQWVLLRGVACKSYLSDENKGQAYLPLTSWGGQKYACPEPFWRTRANTYSAQSAQELILIAYKMLGRVCFYYSTRPRLIAQCGVLRLFTPLRFSPNLGAGRPLGMPLLKFDLRYGTSLSQLNAPFKLI